MDDTVLRSMAKWPDVPAVFGWLGLDRRGRWLIKGETVGNSAAQAFIGRNYACDERGRWFSQNGPQRVFVRLECTPWVLRLEDDGSFTTHTGTDSGTPRGVYVDEEGAVLVDAPCGAGLLDDRDLEAFALRLCGEGGEELDDDEATRRLDELACGGAAQLWVELRDGLQRLSLLPSSQRAMRLGFVTDPRA